MPVSHKHRVIFVHIPRTAGSSIESALGIMGLNNAGDTTRCREMLYGIETKDLVTRWYRADLEQFGYDF